MGFVGIEEPSEIDVREVRFPLSVMSEASVWILPCLRTVNTPDADMSVPASAAVGAAGGSELRFRTAGVHGPERAQRARPWQRAGAGGACGGMAARMHD